MLNKPLGELTLFEWIPLLVLSSNIIVSCLAFRNDDDVKAIWFLLLACLIVLVKK
jgi:hypothetical protein